MTDGFWYTHYCPDPRYAGRAVAFRAAVCDECGQLHRETEPSVMPWSLTYFAIGKMTRISEIPKTRGEAHAILNEGVTQEKSDGGTETQSTQDHHETAGRLGKQNPEA